MKGLKGFFKRFSAAGDSGRPPQSLEDMVNSTADLLEAGSASQAKSLSLKAIEIQPDCFQAWSNLAFAEIQLNNLEAAVAASQRALSIDPSHAVAWHNLGEAYVRMEQGQKALECNNRALTLDPSHAVFWLGKGEALMLLDRSTEAATCFERALALDTGIKGAECNREIALLKANPKRWRLLLIALGMALQHSDKEIDDRDLTARVVACFRDDPDYDKDLIRSFDYFAQINVQLNKPHIISFCHINFMLAAGLRDPDLTHLCSMRWMGAKAKLGSG